MTMVEATIELPRKLGGKSLPARRGKTGSGKNRLNHEPVGYIRGKKVGRHKYYYYCEAVKQPDGSFKEVCEYLGTARAIREAVKQKTGND